MPNREQTVNPKWLESWQSDYDTAVGKGGKVQAVFARIGSLGGLAIFVEVYEHEKGLVCYSPYIDFVPGDGHIENPDEDDSCVCTVCVFELDPAAWLDDMTGAANWGEWDWGESMDSVPGY